MDRYVAQQNVERYRRLLAQCEDDGERRTLQALLAEEEEKLATLIAASRHHPVALPKSE
jgi:hypothetical protein